MALIRDNIKKTKYRKSDLKNLSIGRGSAIVEENQKAIEEKINSEEEKNRLIKEIEEQIKKIYKMNVFEYLRYKNGEIDEKSEDSLSTKDEIEEKLDNLEELIENKEIKYKNLNFKYIYY